MIRILFITTSFSDKGPLQQLFNIIASLDRTKFEPILISLTEPFDGDRREIFYNLNVEIKYFPWRWFYCILPFIFFAAILKDLKPKIIHTSGFLPDVLCGFSRIKYPWVLTIRNDPFIDYPLKFGYLFGHLMAFLHLLAIKLCPAPITCSLGLQKAFKKYNVSTKSIRNGVNLGDFSSENRHNKKSNQKMKFLTAGSLISRKNIELMVKIFSSKSISNIAELTVLGDGMLRKECQKLANSNIFFYGHVANIVPFLFDADCYISLSQSEGMPNSVMEAFAGGLPCVLSNIEAHQEIKLLMVEDAVLMDINSGVDLMIQELKHFILNTKYIDHNKISTKAKHIFDSRTNSFEYQGLYLDEIRKS